jgi:hypothetical protein
MECVCERPYAGAACEKKLERKQCQIGSYGGVVTFDGSKYLDASWTARGELVAYERTSSHNSNGAANKEQVHILRSATAGFGAKADSKVSIVTGVALRSKGETVTFLGKAAQQSESSKNQVRILVDCKEIDIKSLPMTTAQGVVIASTGQTVTATTKTELKVSADMPTFVDRFPRVEGAPKRMAFGVNVDVFEVANGKSEGLCGDFDNSAEDDLDGATSVEAAQRYASNQQVATADSLFACSRTSGALDIASFADGIDYSISASKDAKSEMKFKGFGSRLLRVGQRAKDKVLSMLQRSEEEVSTRCEGADKCCDGIAKDFREECVSTFCSIGSCDQAQLAANRANFNAEKATQEVKEAEQRDAAEAKKAKAVAEQIKKGLSPTGEEDSGDECPA